MAALFTMMMKLLTHKLLPGCCLALLAGCSLAPTDNPLPTVYATAETTPVATGGDAADDPAVWINYSHPENSLILGTNKKSGLAIYDLDGNQVQFIEAGRLNNVDIRQGVSIDGKTVDLAAATNRTTTAIDLFTISDSGEVSTLHSIALDLTDPYGLCLYHHQQQVHVFVNSKDGRYQQWLVNPDGRLAPQLAGEFQMQSQPEGCAANDVTQTLYVGEENLGIWSMPADAERSSEKQLIDSMESGHLTADVEGMDIYQTDTESILVVSSQGNNSYALYDLNEQADYLGSFRIGNHPHQDMDGAEETDGLAVTSVNLGGSYSQGLLVVQDGFNRRPRANQNFKVVPWLQIEALLANGNTP